MIVVLMLVALADIKGDKATSKLTGFDFDKTWIVRDDKVPAALKDVK